MEKEKNDEILVAELPQFTITTSVEEILAQRSIFNPFPHLAREGGIKIWSIKEPGEDPNVIIMYPKTKEMYETRMPLTTQYNEFEPPQRLDAIPQKYIALEKYLGRGNWRDIALEMECLCLYFVNKEENKGNIYPLLEEAVVQNYEKITRGQSQIPIFEEPNIAVIKIIKSAVQALEDGKWREASSLVFDGLRITQYRIKGKGYPEEARNVYDYVRNEFAADIDPVQRKLWSNPSRRDVVAEISQWTETFISHSIRKRALQIALEEYAQYPAAEAHIMKVLKEVEKNQEVSKWYLDDRFGILQAVMQYLQVNNINVSIFS